MASRVFVETTVPSAYASNRADAGSVHRRERTKAWWNEQLRHYDVSTSDAVTLELQQGNWPGKDVAVKLMESMPRLLITDEVVAVAERYVRERVVPADMRGDALHLATACVHEMDFLLTWNIRHLANPNKAVHLTVLNRRLGLLTPQIVTPADLWMENEA